MIKFNTNIGINNEMRVSTLRTLSYLRTHVNVLIFYVKVYIVFVFFFSMFVQYCNMVVITKYQWQTVGYLYCEQMIQGARHCLAEWTSTDSWGI